MGYAESKNLTTYDVLIIASMIEREVQVPEERELVAAVIYNRLDDGHAARDRRDDPLRARQLRRAADRVRARRSTRPTTPASTRACRRRRSATPASPRSRRRPNPADVDYLYYVVKPGTCGEHVFTDDRGRVRRSRRGSYDEARARGEGGSPTDC